MHMAGGVDPSNRAAAEHPARQRGGVPCRSHHRRRRVRVAPRARAPRHTGCRGRGGCPPSLPACPAVLPTCPKLVPACPAVPLLRPGASALSPTGNLWELLFRAGYIWSGCSAAAPDRPAAWSCAMQTDGCLTGSWSGSGWHLQAGCGSKHIK